MSLGGRFLALASIGLAAAIGMTGCDSEPMQTALPAGSTVIALGDSLTYGYGANTETAYPTVLAELSKWRVINAGVNGDTSADVLTRVNEITEQSPDLVLLGVGGNDVLQRIAPDTLQSKNINVVLIAEPHLSTSALYSDGWSIVLSDDALKSDRIHASAAGYRQFAEGLHGYLKDEGWVH